MATRQEAREGREAKLDELHEKLTGAVESTATTLPEIIQEMLLTRTSERQGRAIDKDAGGAGMEKKKQEGYF